MKYNIKIISLLILLYLFAIFIGFYITNFYLEKNVLPFGIESPEIEQQDYSFIPLSIFIIFATFLGLLLIKFNMSSLWRLWFFLSILLTLTISFGAFFVDIIALLLAFLFASIRIFKPNFIVHNFTELFIYGALAALFVPILSITSVIILLLIISLYDYIAVRKTKHMIKLAKWQGKSKLFAGLLIPYEKGAAILGGGDIGFTLLFSATVMKSFSLPLFSFKNFIIPICCAIILAGLYMFGKKKKFYPAMPYLTTGCLIGLGIVLLLI